MKVAILSAALTVATLAGSVSAQSLTTLYNRNNGGSNGGAVYFDIVVGPNPIEILSLATNTADLNIAFDMDIYMRAGTSVGFESSIAGWSVVSTASGIAAGANVPTNMSLSTTFVLAPNTTYGVALDILGTLVGHDYSGTGTNPAPGALQYSNADLTLNLGAAGNTPFSGAPFRPRIWNGTIFYRVVPAPSALAVLGLAGLAASRRRR